MQKRVLNRREQLTQMKTHTHRIAAVEAGSIADELGIEPGDLLLSVDGHEIEDIFDYQFYVEEDELLLRPGVAVLG